MSSPEKISQVYTPNPNATEPANTQAIISALNLQKHVEGGYYAEIDRNPLTIPNPFLLQNGGDEEDVKNTAEKPMSGDNGIRNASTSIYYMLSAVNPQGHFHRNKGRTVCMPQCVWNCDVGFRVLISLHRYTP
jgi:predicted cupin superfamily sugar epimerase